MQHPSLLRTRSQHVVSSPRRMISPLKAKSRHANTTLVHVNKKRKVNVPALGVSKIVNLVEEEEEEVVEVDNKRNGLANGKKGKGRGRIELGEEDGDLAVTEGEEEGDGEEEYESSPKKRKRKDGEFVSSSQSTVGSGGSSWIEVDEEEEQPEFIAESDQHLLAEAPARALHKLPKSELIRLWKVAGMWSTEEEDDGEVEPDEEEDDGGLDKKQLVEGLVAARRHSHSLDRLISPLPSPHRSPRRNGNGLGSSIDLKTSRSISNNTTNPHSPASSSSPSRSPSKSRPHHTRSAHFDINSTPRASNPSRSRGRHLNGSNGTRSAPARRQNGETPKPNQGQKRSKSLGNAQRKTRSGDAKTPGKGRVMRRNSTLDSGFITTDTSDIEGDGGGMVTPRRRSKGKRKVGDEVIVFLDSSDEEVEGGQAGKEDEEVDEPTPLVSRLRSRVRRKSRGAVDLGEVEEDGDGGDEAETVDDNEEVEEEEAEEEEEEADGSPVSQRRLRSRDKKTELVEDEEDEDVEMEEEEEDPEEEVEEEIGVEEEEEDADEESGGEQTTSRRLPKRTAKRKALQALAGKRGKAEVAQEEDTEDVMDVDEDEELVDEDELDAEDIAVDEEIEVDDDEAADEEGEIEAPRSGPMTRSRKSQASPSLTPLSQDESTSDVEAKIRTTRSGKAFGDMRSRRMQLRQEAMDDPDMADEEEEDAEEDESGVLEGLDLSLSTVASLTRLLRDELVQLCEARGIDTGGTKPQLAQALLDWQNEQSRSETTSIASSQATAKTRKSKSKSKSKTSRSRNSRNPPSSARVIHAIASHTHVSGKTTPVLMRDHIHASDPATPPRSDETNTTRQTNGKSHNAGENGDGELDLDLSELGLENSVIVPEQLVKLEKIGSGGFKDVYVGKYRRSKVAIAEFRSHLSEMDINELRLLGELSHPNIVRFRGICIPEDNSQVPCMLVSELCENGDLFDYIRNVSCPPIKRVLHLMLDIAKGLEYLHTRVPSIIHRDCKSSNILINAAGQAKVGDFGLARVKRSTRSMVRSLVGTVNWQAPELWHPQPRYDYKVDVFSAALVYWEMLAGWTGEKNYPWEGFNEHYIYDAVGAKHRRPSVAGLRKYWGTEPVNLVERMWHQDPRERPTMTDVVADLEAILAGPQ